MKKSLQIYLVFFLLIFLTSCKGQDQTGQPKNSTRQIERNLFDSISTYTDFDVIFTPNAPTRITRKIKQDKEGNLLIAAYDDIIRYDVANGVFTNFTQEQGLENCTAFDVLEAKNGNIWIASDQSGAYRFVSAPGQFTHFTTEDGLAHRRNMCIYEDRASNIWIGGQGGASRYDGKAFLNFTTKEGLTHNDVNCIMEDKAGNIWFGTRETACVYDGKTFTEIRNNEGKPFVNVWSIIEDQKGNIWLGNGEGLWRYDGSSFTNVTTDGGGTLYEDSAGNIWTTKIPGFEPSVLSRYDEGSLLNEKAVGIQAFETDGALLGILEDKDGNIWVGGDEGVWRYDGKKVNYFTGKQATD